MAEPADVQAHWTRPGVLARIDAALTELIAFDHFETYLNPAIQISSRMSSALLDSRTIPFLFAERMGVRRQVAGDVAAGRALISD
jgi:hypothetical protein